MTGPGRRALAGEEALRAEEELRAADALLAAGFPRVAVTRAYFAAFHIARAALYVLDLVPRSHEGTLHLLNLHYVRTGRLEVEQGRVLARLQKYRGEADHGEASVIDARAAAEDIAAARAFCARVRSALPDVLPGPG